MNNLLKVSAAALFLAVGLTSCESKPAATDATTTPTTTESTTTTTATTDTAATSTAPAAAPADGAMATDTTKKM